MIRELKVSSTERKHKKEEALKWRRFVERLSSSENGPLFQLCVGGQWARMETVNSG